MFLLLQLKITFAFSVIASHPTHDEIVIHRKPQILLLDELSPILYCCNSLIQLPPYLRDS